MTGSSYERELKDLLEQDGYYVTRSAGSQAIDLVALNKKNGNSILIEVKSFKGNAFRISKSEKLRLQHEEMCNLARSFRGYCTVMYALRKKGQSEYRFVHPDKLSKPYNWNKEGNGAGPVQPVRLVEAT